MPPEAFSHDFMSLGDNIEILYQMSEYYAPQCAKGVRWNNPAFDIAWPSASTLAEHGLLKELTV